ncbi:MAG TPA: hypothetical protein PLJ27_19080 [Polyangiaceae bacterium]|nr:MAG: hypothetical protein BWY17_05059 [Deltaproteobacteria bacterium ADurb.Bin207]HQK19570.1 hypothetical protein [Polyangiaceae bacterium]
MYTSVETKPAVVRGIFEKRHSLAPPANEQALDFSEDSSNSQGMKRLIPFFISCLLVACASDDEGYDDKNPNPSDAGKDVAADTVATDSNTKDTATNDVVDDKVTQPDVIPDAIPEATPDTNPEDTGVPDVGPDVEFDAPADVKPDIGPVSSCSELSTNECFSNKDCVDTLRCSNAGTETDPVPCCVSGPRGTGKAGTPCKSENDCESGVCIEGTSKQLCSKACSSNDDCPDGMKDCRYIWGSGSSDDWCFPTN